MKRALTIQNEYAQVETIEDLASVFESIASIHISKIKDKVVSSTDFFNELWGIYSQLRVDEPVKRKAQNAKPALVAVTSEGGLIGDIDEKIITGMLADPRQPEADIYVIGSHGVTLIAQHNIRPVKAFSLPNIEGGGSVNQIAEILNTYEKATVYYQRYVSLAKQDIAQIELFSAVAALGKEQEAQQQNLISPKEYIFEPSIKEIIEYMESVMLQIALAQVVLESKLAQHASRFNAMSGAKVRAKDLRRTLGFALSSAKRSQGDERTKEILSAMKLARRNI